jgi:hypothetical protein
VVTVLRCQLTPAQMRYDGPVEQATFRVATRDVELGGVMIPAGEAVMAVVPSADHDHTRLPEPAGARQRDEIRTLPQPPEGFAAHVAIAGRGCFRGGLGY